MGVLEDLEARKRSKQLQSDLAERKASKIKTFTPEESKDLGEFEIPFEANIPDPSKISAADMLKPNYSRQAKTAFGLLTTFDPKKQLKVIKENYPDIKVVGQDEEGRPIVDATAYGGNVGFINAPGITARDLLQFGFQAALFTPAGKAGQVSKALSTIPRKAAAVSAASALTQTGQELASQAAQGEEPSLGKVSGANVALAGITAGLSEALFLKLGQSLPVIREKIRRSGITEEVRKIFRGAAKSAGKNPDEVTDDLIASFIRSTDEAVSPEQAAKLQGEREFGIDLTKGQRTGSQRQLSFEDTARSGILGEKPQRTMLQMEAKQAEQARAAKEAIQTKIGKGADLISDQPQVGGLLAQGVKTAEKIAASSIDDAYSQIGEAYLNGKNYAELLKATKEAVKGIEYVKSKSLAPASREMLDMIDNFLGTVGEQAAEIKPQHIKQIELIRRTINNYKEAAVKPADLRTMTRISRGFDNWLDNAVKNSLFSGDDAAIEQLKKARSLYSEYRTKFTAQPKLRKGGGTFPDPEGTMVEKIISSNPTDIQTINSIYGAGDGFGNMAGKNMAMKFKDIVGKDSTEWQAVRQAGFLRLVKTMPDGKTISGQKTFTAIEKALKNRELMEEIFTPKEIGLLKRFAAQIKRTQPDLVRSRENPSGTAQKLIKGMSQLFQRLGFATGDPVLMAGGKGVEVASGFRAASRAKKAVRPFQKIYDVRPELTGITTGATMTAEGQ